MDALLIEGGIPLKGSINIHGAKNAVLPEMVVSLLTDAPLKLRFVPYLHDVDSMSGLLSNLGVTINREGKDKMILRHEKETAPIAPYDIVRKMRASILVLGPLLSRFGYAKVSIPGGCNIGARPVDQHLKALSYMGAEISVEHGYIYAKADRLKGTDITFDLVTVTGTENILLAATLATGKTIIRNTAREPEIVDLALLLKKMGAKIKGEGTSIIEIDGVDSLSGVDHEVIPDRIETGTLIMASLMTNGNITLKNISLGDIGSVIDKLIEAGAELEAKDREIAVYPSPNLKATDMNTNPFPGFPTDLQAQYMALMTQASGASTIRENIFDNRFMHVPELKRMGAEISVEGSVAVVKGKTQLTGADVMASDLRASACLVLAAIAANGESRIHRIYHLDRGYERLDELLSALGAKIKRLSE